MGAITVAQSKLDLDTITTIQFEIYNGWYFSISTDVGWSFVISAEPEHLVIVNRGSTNPFWPIR